MAKSHTESPNVRVQSLPSSRHELKAWQTGSVHVRRCVPVNHEDNNQSPTWRRLRELMLSQDPLCRTCSIAGRIALATVVDHIVPVKAGGARFDIANLQGLCVACHNRKTAIETAQRSGTPRGLQSLGGKPSDAQGGQDYCGREIRDPLS